MNRDTTTKRNPEYVDMFVAGLTGSGKSTVASFLHSYYGMRKMRIAGTIKQIICEDLGVTPDELEERKRKDPAVRLKHHEVSQMLGNQHGSLNRTALIAAHESFDLTIVDDPENPIVVEDVRTKDEAIVLLDANWVGIFLERTTDEFRKADHFTENNMFDNGTIVELSNMLDYGERMVVVFNGSMTKGERLEFIEKLSPDVTVASPPEKCTGEQLVEFVDMVLDKWLAPRDTHKG
jgi:adenylate kinase